MIRLRRGKWRQRLGAERQFGDDRAALAQGVVEAAVFLRVDDVGAAGDDRDRAAVERTEMRRRIDAARHPRHHHDARLAEPGGQLARDAAAVGRGVARPDHCDHRRLQQLEIAQHGQHRRRVFDGGQRRRVSGLAPAHQRRAEAIERAQLRLGIAQTHRRDPARQLSQSVERRASRAEAAQQRVERHRPDGFGTGEPQPVHAFLGIELACGQVVSAFAEGDPAFGAGDEATDILVMPQNDEQRDAGDQPGARRIDSDDRREGNGRDRTDQRGQ